MKPLFIPLKAEFYEAFENGTKDTEYRKAGPRWSPLVCAIGRKVTLSYGYGKSRRMSGTITAFRHDHEPHKLPGWVACYGEGAGVAACITIKIDQTATRNAFACPQCGNKTPELNEGYCEPCRDWNQQKLDEHNARFEYWESLKPEQRDYQIRNAM